MAQSSSRHSYYAQLSYYGKATTYSTRREDEQRRNIASLVKCIKVVVVGIVIAVALATMTGCDPNDPVTSVKNVAQCYDSTGMGTTCLAKEVLNH